MDQSPEELGTTGSVSPEEEREPGATEDVPAEPTEEAPATEDVPAEPTEEVPAAEKAPESLDQAPTEPEVPVGEDVAATEAGGVAALSVPEEPAAPEGLEEPEELGMPEEAQAAVSDAVQAGEPEPVVEAGAALESAVSEAEPAEEVAPVEVPEAAAVAEPVPEEPAEEAVVEVPEAPTEEEEAEVAAAERPPDPFRGPGEWYVVHTYAGYENKVKANLESRIHSMQMEDKIFDVHIPMEDVMEIKGGKKQVVQRKVFPGYLLVKMYYDNDSWYVVRNTPGVTGFVSSGTGTKPTPLSKREVEKILVVKQEEVKPTFRLDFQEGDTVRIISGPFADFNGTISEINVDQSKLKVLVNIFDRETPVELGFDQVAKV